MKNGDKTLNASPQVIIPIISVTDELKKNKDLLISSIIKQEEFDVKKKQLLGLYGKLD